MFWFSLCLSETFLLLRRTHRDIIVNVHGYSCKVPIILSYSNSNWIFSTDFRKILKYQISWKSVKCHISWKSVKFQISRKSVYISWKSVKFQMSWKSIKHQISCNLSNIKFHENLSVIKFHENPSNIKFHENSCSGNRVLWEVVDRWT
jgi:competence transcription factor ComK